MNIKILIVIFYLILPIDIKSASSSYHGSDPELTISNRVVPRESLLTLLAQDSLSSAERVSGLRDSRSHLVFELERRVLVLEQRSFSDKIEEMKTYFDRLDSKKLDIDVAMQDLNAKFLQLHELKEQIQHFFEHISQAVQIIKSQTDEHALRLSTLETTAQNLDFNNKFLLDEMRKIYQRCAVVEDKVVDKNSLVVNPSFFTEIEPILARLLTERFKRSERLQSSDDDVTPLDGRASTASFISQDSSDNGLS